MESNNIERRRRSGSVNPLCDKPHVDAGSYKPSRLAAAELRLPCKSAFLSRIAHGPSSPLIDYRWLWLVWLRHLTGLHTCLASRQALNGSFNLSDA